MKRMILLTTLTMGALSVSAGAAGCMTTIQQRGLTVGTSPDYPPYETLNDQNQIVGFDIDLINGIAKRIGIKVNVVGQSFDGLIPALVSKKIDLIASSMTITEERRKSVAFSVPYISTQNVILTRKENLKLSSLAQLTGKTVGVQLGSSQEKIAQGIKGANVKLFNLYTDVGIALQNRQIDAMLVAKPVGQQFLKTYPDMRMTGVLNKVESGLAMRKDCPDLTNRVNAALIQMRKSGELEAISAKWLK